MPTALMKKVDNIFNASNIKTNTKFIHFLCQGISRYFNFNTKCQTLHNPKINLFIVPKTVQCTGECS